MMDFNSRLVRVELHAHTCFSKDSLVRPEHLLEHCAKLGIDWIAVTDHNEIEGAFMASQLAPDRVIVGEEIETTGGELIGYFMQEWVPPGLEPMAAVARLRDQGALISVPHPFDTVRSKHWTQAGLEEILPYVDALETFNARCLNNQPNQAAAACAQQHGLLETVGSDAHSLWEVGRATLRLPEFEDAEGFQQALVSAEKATRRSPAFVHLFSRFAVFVKGFTAST